MKAAVVRARIDEQLKADAESVLGELGLEMSDAIRLFLRQVVLHRGLPFEVRDANVREASSKHLWAMKREQQARDRKRAARGGARAGDALLIRPHRLKGVRVEWPDAPLIDE